VLQQRASDGGGRIAMAASIDKAGRDDAQAILDLLARSALPVDGVLDHLDTALVARDGDRVVGSAVLEVYQDGALLRSVAVDASLRGAGLGQELTRSALTLADTLGVPAVYLLTTTAEAFFPKFEFSRIDRSQVPATVQDSVEFRSACPASAVVMRRML
jgi:amino-acid N-acetyltransferase